MSFQRNLLSLSLLAACVVSTATSSSAQTASEEQKDQLKIFQLHNVAQENDAKEVLVALRNILQPTDKVYLVYNSSQIVLWAPPAEIERAGTIITALDQPKPAYRLTYTIAESENGKRIGVQHFSMVAVIGQRADLKQGDKVPVITGSLSTDKMGEQTQFTYLDIGMNISSTLDRFANGLRLRSKVEQSSIAPSTAAPAVSNAASQDPIIRQSLLEGTSVLVPGKPLNLGGMDFVGSTRHLDFEVVAEPLTEGDSKSR